MTDEKQEIKRVKGGLFAPGVSTNPAGKSKEAGIVGEYRKKLQAKLPEVIEMLIQRTMEGDPVSMKLYLERVLPALKPESAPININLPEKANLTTLGESIIAAIAQGAISVEAGTQLMSTLTGQARLVEVTELESRIAKLEEVSGKAQE